METPKQIKSPLDASGFLSSKAIARDKLIASVSLPQEEDWFAATVHLLEARRLVRDEGELQDVLGCSGKQIQAARERATQALASKDTLGRYIEMRTHETSEKPEEAPRPAEAAGKKLERPEKALAATAKRYFSANPEHIGKMELRRREKYVHWAVILIAQLVLKKTVDEAAEIAGVESISASHMRRDGREEYAAKGFFYETVQKICKELGIPAP